MNFYKNKNPIFLRSSQAADQNIHMLRIAT